MSVVRDFCGHGLGRLFHDEPNIVHVGRAGEGIVLKPGMFFTVEPMINLGRPHVKVLSDGWTAVTRDRSLSAQFEHSVGVTDEGVEVFTFSPGRARQAALQALSPHPHSSRNRPSSIGGAAELTDRRQGAAYPRPPRIITATANGCATRFRDAGSDAVSDYELLELVLFRAIPQRDVKPLGQGADRQIRLLRRSGGGAHGTARRGQGPGRRRHHRAQDRAGRGAAAWRASKCRSGRCCRPGRA